MADTKDGNARLIPDELPKRQAVGDQKHVKVTGSDGGLDPDVLSSGTADLRSSFITATEQTVHIPSLPHTFPTPPPAMSSFLSSLTGASGKSKVLSQNDNDVVIVSAVRSAITKVC